MTYRVLSGRMDWPAGTLVSADDLAGCNIAALIEAGHLAEVGKAAPDKQGVAEPTQQEDN